MSRHSGRPIAALDACVLGGALRRNILLSLAEADLFRPKWSARILEETQKAISKMTKSKTDGSRQREKIEDAFPEALVTEYESLEKDLNLPDADDRHVLAAAIKASASVIVTDNLVHFPVKALRPYALKAMSANDFIIEMVEFDLPRDLLALERMRRRFKKPMMSKADLIHKTKAQGLPGVAAILSEYRQSLQR